MSHCVAFRSKMEVRSVISASDFSKKQIVFVLFNEGEKLCFSNDNLVIKDSSGKIKFQCTCYRIFIVFAVGHTTFTSAVIQKAQKFGFYIALLTPGFKLYSIMGAAKDGNTLLRRKQYEYSGLDIAKKLIENKISNQAYELQSVRNKSENLKEAILLLKRYISDVSKASTLNELMGYEGMASKVYFKNHFNNIEWQGRQPRIKKDYINSVLDIGYTLLFTYMDALLSAFGFDTYCGVMHRQFYMRKSLVCDLVEPFRTLIDHAVKTGINIKQIQENDFIEINHQFRLKWDTNGKYIEILMKPLIENKEDIFNYVQTYYRAFMKNLPADMFPCYYIGGLK